MAKVTHEFALVYGQTKQDVIGIGAIGSPPLEGISIGLNDIEVNNQVGIMSGITQCRDYVIDNGLYESLSAGTIYVYIPFGGGDGDVVQETILGNIPADTIIIGLAGNFRTKSFGSNAFQSLVEMTCRYMRDNYLKQL